MENKAISSLLECPLCDYSTVERVNLQNHQLFHDEENKTLFRQEIIRHKQARSFDLPKILSAPQTKSINVGQGTFEKKADGRSVKKEELVCSALGKDTSGMRYTNSPAAKSSGDSFKDNNRDRVKRKPVRKRRVKARIITLKGKRSFKCSFCPFRSAKRVHCITHELIHTSPRITCAFCDFSDTRKFRVQMHERLTHVGQNPYFCPNIECSFRADSINSLAQHVNAVHGLTSDMSEGKFEISESKVEAKDEDDLNPVNIKSLSDKCKVPYDLLGIAEKLISASKTFETPKVTLKDGKTTEKAQKTDESRTEFQCRFCPRVSARKAYLSRHEQAHITKVAGESVVEPAEEDKFSSESAIKKPMCKIRKQKKKVIKGKHRFWILAKNGNFQYNPVPEENRHGANLEFTGQYLSENVRGDVGVKLFECDLCDYENKSQWNVLVHRRRHTGEKPLRCRFCPFTTAYNGSLRQHERRHFMGMKLKV